MVVIFGRYKMMFFKTFVVRGEQLSGVLLNLPFNAHCLLLHIFTGTLSFL